MTTGTTCLRQEPRASLANPATIIVVAMITAMTFSASGAAPTPLYHLYQEHFRANIRKAEGGNWPFTQSRASSAAWTLTISPRPSCAARSPL